MGGLVPGLYERITATDAETGVATRLLRFDPGTDTSAAGPQVHAFWEEVYILEGSFTDLTLGETFTAGMYACRPPGMPHGPWRSRRANPVMLRIIEFRLRQTLSYTGVRAVI